MDLYACDWNKTLDVLKSWAGFALGWCLKASRCVVVHHTADGGVSFFGGESVGL